MSKEKNRCLECMGLDGSQTEHDSPPNAIIGDALSFLVNFNSMGFGSLKQKGDANRAAFKGIKFCYSAFWSCAGLVMAIVSPTSPTLKRAKRRTEMFSPSLPILLAIN